MRKKRTNFETRQEAGGIGRRAGKQRMMSRRKEKVSRVASGSGGLEWRAGRMVGYTSFILLGLVMLGILFPLVPASSHAEEVGMERVGMEGPTAAEFSSSVHTDIKSYVRSTIALSITGQVNLDLMPKAQGTFSTESAKLSVSTNNVSGYSVYLAMVDSQTNSLLPMNTRSTEEIMATPAVLTAENYQSYLNTWGYKVAGDAGYQAVPRTAGAPIITAGTSSQTAEYDLSFAVAVGADLPAGVYGNQVLVSTIANPIEIRGINDITFMQEMTSDICLVSFENETKQLIDTRDGKSYWVAKLKDGNCWMTQNLALDITEDGLKASDTDIEEDWNQSSQYPPSRTNDTLVAVPDSGQNSTDSWNMGEWALATPLLVRTCDGVSSLTSCTKVGAVDVSNKAKFQPNYVAKIGNWEGITTSNDTMVAVSCNEWAGDKSCIAGTYDAHYLVGNFYQWNTATAGTGARAINAYASGSICPKGWGMPKTGGAMFEGNVSGSFAYLLKQYGLANSSVGGSITGTGIDGKTYDIADAPIYGMRGGHIIAAQGKNWNFGRIGYLWSSTGGNDDRAYWMEFSTSTNLMYAFYRQYGLPVRCVAK